MHERLLDRSSKVGLTTYCSVGLPRASVRSPLRCRMSCRRIPGLGLDFFFQRSKPLLLSFKHLFVPLSPKLFGTMVPAEVTTPTAKHHCPHQPNPLFHLSPERGLLRCPKQHEAGQATHIVFIWPAPLDTRRAFKLRNDENRCSSAGVVVSTR